MRSPPPRSASGTEDDLTFTIDGSPRTYLGALSRFDIEPITSAAGLDVRSLQITLAANAPETEDLVRGFVIRLAPWSCISHSSTPRRPT